MVNHSTEWLLYTTYIEWFSYSINSKMCSLLIKMILQRHFVNFRTHTPQKKVNRLSIKLMHFIIHWLNFNPLTHNTAFIAQDRSDILTIYLDSMRHSQDHHLQTSHTQSVWFAISSCTCPAISIFITILSKECGIAVTSHGNMLNKKQNSILSNE